MYNNLYGPAPQLSEPYLYYFITNDVDFNGRLLSLSEHDLQSKRLPIYLKLVITTKAGSNRKNRFYRVNLSLNLYRMHYLPYNSQYDVYTQNNRKIDSAVSSY